MILQRKSLLLLINNKAKAFYMIIFLINYKIMKLVIIIVLEFSLIFLLPN